jgi:hypothetical protein
MIKTACPDSKPLLSAVAIGLGAALALAGCDDDASVADAGTADAADADAGNRDGSATDSANPDLPDAAFDGNAGLADAVDVAAAGNAPTLASIMTEYSTWTKRTAAPVAISSEIFALCRAPTTAEQQFVGSVHGNNRALLDWLNPAAASGIAAGGTAPFAVGAAIVKEKLVGSSAGGFTLAARGFMVKRAPGFDPSVGDWEFAYWEPSSGIVAGRTQTAACSACHANTRATDWVFMDQDWRRL